MKISMSAVWDRTTEFLSDNLTAIAGIAALTIFLPAAISSSLAPLGTGGSLGLVLGLGALSLAFGLLSLWGQLSVTALALDPAAGAAASRARASRRFGSMVLVLVVVLLAVFVLTLPVLGILIANGVDLARLDQPGALASLPVGAAATILLYGSMLALVILFLSARILVLLAPVVLTEDKAVGAIGRAFRLTRGMTWRVIGVLLLYGIVMFVATLAAKTVFGALFALIVKSANPVSVATVLTAIVGALVSTVFSVIGAAFTAKLYLAARAREDTAPA